jgi:hypothetical protein
MNVSHPFPIVISKRLLLYLAIYVVLLLMPILLKILDPQVPQALIPSFPILLTWAFPLLVSYQLRNPASQIFAIVWILWFVVGSLNLLASYRYYGVSYLLDAGYPALIYIAFLLALVSGMYFYEKVLARVRLIKGKRVNTPDQLRPLLPIFAELLLIFPLIWFGSMVLSLGYIPLLSSLLEGQNIVQTMYALNYGPLYGYGIVNVLSILVAIERFYTRKGPAKYLFLALVAIFALFMIASGKRHWLILSGLAVLVFLLRTKRVSPLRTFLVLAVVAGLYIGLEIIRRGSETAAFSSFWGKLLAIGHEYRTFAYVVNHFKPGEIENYNWLISTIAAMINSTVLRVSGFDKESLVQLSSAFSWRYIFYSQFGIRAGIIAELYMAYGFPGACLLFVFGVIIAWLNDHLIHTESQKSLLFLSVIFGLFMLTLVDSTNDLTGSLTVLFYVWVVYFVLRILIPRRPSARCSVVPERKMRQCEPKDFRPR